MSDPITASYEATKAEYRQLGNSGLKVSLPILGTMSFGDKRWAPWVIEEAEALPLLKSAFDKGLTTWDTANFYSNGVTEEIIGKALKKYDIPRGDVSILTKCYFTVGKTPDVAVLKHGEIIGKTKDYVNKQGLSRGAIIKAVNDSLKRLDTDYIDLLQIHRFDSNTPIEETMSALNDLVHAGKVHYIGASSMWTWQFAMMQECAKRNGWTQFVSMQNQYSLMYREEEREMNKYCHATGVGLIPWAPLYRGALARPPDTHGSTTRSSGQQMAEPDRAIAERVHELAEKKGWAMSQVAMAWILEYVTSPIIGISKEERMDEALEVRGKKLTAEEIAYLEELYKPKPIAGHS